jgi:hypothetical protein
VVILAVVLAAALDAQDSGKGKNKKLDKQIEAAIEKGVEVLVKAQKPDGTWEHIFPIEGATALSAYTLIRSRGKISNRDVLGQLQEALKKAEPHLTEFKIRDHLPEGYEQYGIALTLMTLEALDAKKHKDRIVALTDYLICQQGSEGGWGYGKAHKPDPGVVRTQGSRSPKKKEIRYYDLSTAQYVMLGLWAAGHASLKIADDVWVDAARWLIQRQDAEGQWKCCYVGVGDKGGKVNLTMTAAGIAGLLLCKRNMSADSWKQLSTEATAAIQKGIRHVEKHWKDETQDSHHKYSHFYAMYGLERMCALMGVDALGGENWYYVGAEKLILKYQKPDGSFSHPQDTPDMGNGSHHPVPRTCFALLFLNRATGSFIATEGGK